MHLPESHPFTAVWGHSARNISPARSDSIHLQYPSIQKGGRGERGSRSAWAKDKKNKQPGRRVLFQHLFQREPEREGYSPNAALGSTASAFELEKGVALAVLFPFVSPSRGFPPAPLPNPENPPPPPEGTTKPLKPLKAPPLSDWNIKKAHFRQVDLPPSNKWQQDLRKSTELRSGGSAPKRNY